jgi:hypothetical protein
MAKKNRPMKLLVGADPEVFIKKDGEYVPAWGLPFGNKHKPLKTKHGSVQVDGLAMEFNSYPAATEKGFIHNVKSAFQDLQGLLVSHDPGFSVDIVPVADFDKAMATLPDEAKVLGCNMDFDAYSMSPNEIPCSGEVFRTGAGHIHLGFTNKGEPDSIPYVHYCAAIVRELDYYLGLPSLKWDTDGRRRKLYGKAGAFRPKPYGLEYRVLSNKWLSDEKLIGFVFRQASDAYHNFKKGNLLQDKYGNFAENMINDNVTGWRYQNDITEIKDV